MAARASVVVEMSGDEAKLLRSMRKVMDAEREADLRREESGKKADRRQGKLRGYADTQVKQLRNIALGYIGINAAISVGTTLLQQRAQVAREAGQRVKELLPSGGQLAQISSADMPLSRLRDLSRQTSRTGGLTMPEAQTQILALSNAGLLNMRQDFARLSGRGIIADVPTTATALNQISSSMPGAGTPEDILQDAFRTASTLPTTANRQLQQTARIGGAARGLGLSREQALAITSAAVPELQQRTPEIMSSFLSRLGAIGGFEGMTVPEMIQNIQGRDMTTQQAIKFFGDRTALEGFRAISTPAAQQRFATAMQQQGMETDAITERIREFDRDPMLKSAFDLRRATARRQIGDERMGLIQTEFESEVEGMKQGQGAFMQGFTGSAAWLFGNTIGAENTLRLRRTFGQDLRRSTDQALDGGAINSAFRSLDNAGEKLQRSADAIINSRNSNNPRAELTPPQE